MNQLYKKLINPALLSRLSLIKTNCISNLNANTSTNIHQIKCISNTSILCDFKTFQATKSFKTNARSRDDHDDEDFLDHEVENTKPKYFSSDRNEPRRSFDRERGGGFGGNRKEYGFGNRSGGFNNNFDGQRKSFKKNFESKDSYKEYEGAEPIETTGEATSYKGDSQASFSTFDIPEELQARLKELGYETPFEIQTETLKHTLAGKDLIGKAFTGSGKTLAFAIPIISRLLRNPETMKNKFPKCLVLSPTRELCLQLTKTISELCPRLKCLAVYGGAGMNEQTNALRGHIDIVCATPGRLRDLTNRQYFKTDSIELICLDEADQLLNNNFLDQIKDIIEISNKKQMLMFSATINKNVLNLKNIYMKDTVTVDLTKGQRFMLPKNIEHFIHGEPVARHMQAKVINHYIKKFDSDRCIIFTNKKSDAIALNYNLQRYGIRSTDFHSDVSQSRREILLGQFRKGRLNVLVATDVAARGIDIPEINLIIHVGAPVNGMDYYVHRSGRAGRAGRVGQSVLLDDGDFRNRDAISDLKRVVKFKTLEKPVFEKSEADDNTERENRAPFDRRESSYNYRDRNSGSGYNREEPPRKYSSFNNENDMSNRKFSRF